MWRGSERIYLLSRRRHNRLGSLENEEAVDRTLIALLRLLEPFRLHVGSGSEGACLVIHHAIVATVWFR